MVPSGDGWVARRVPSPRAPRVGRAYLQRAIVLCRPKDPLPSRVIPDRSRLEPGLGPCSGPRDRGCGPLPGVWADVGTTPGVLKTRAAGGATARKQTIMAPALRPGPAIGTSQVRTNRAPSRAHDL